MAQSRQLAAIMFTDMVGYTALMQQNEQLAIQKRDRSQKIFEDALAKYNGKLLQYYGDGTLSIFTSAVKAIQSAIEIQTLNLQPPKIDVRIGIHIGEVVMDDKGIYGDSVNVASRIESLAVPGSVFISEKIFDDVKNYEGISAKALGYFELKNVKQPIQVFAITNTGIVVPSREDVKGKVKETLNSIAVLPFANLSSDPENEFFSDGMTEELLNVLAKINGLHVTSRTSSFAFKGKKEDVREIATKLNVQKILEGSVRKAGNKVRITAQLVNAADGYHIWSATYDRSIEDIFAVQDEISREIANKLRANLNEHEHTRRLVKVPTENLEAYKKYLQGLHFYDSIAPEGKYRALELFSEAIQLDPNLANAYSMLAITYALIGQTGLMSLESTIQLTKNYAAKANEIDPHNSRSLLAMCSVKFFFEWDWKASHELATRAIEINPNDAFAHASMALYFNLFLRFDEALKEMLTAYYLDPVDADTVASLARTYLIIKKYDEALAHADEALALNPQNFLALNIKGYATGLKRDWRKALEQFEATHKIIGDFPLALMALGIAHARLNQINEAKEIITRLEQMQRGQPAPVFDYVLSILYLETDDYERFFSSYEHGMAQKSFWLIEAYGTELMEKIHYDKRIIESRKKLGLPVFDLPIRDTKDIHQ